MSSNIPAIGIDLGTTCCCVGYLTANNHDVDIIENQQGDRTTPSYIAFTDENEVVGKPAKEKVFRNQKNVVFDTKRLIGRKFDDEYLQNNLKTWPFSVISSDTNTPLIEITRNDKIVAYTPHEISAKLLCHMKAVAEARLGKKVCDAVITVPAYFNYHQRIATAEAGKLAGLNVLKIMNEPTAAALAYVHKHNINDCKSILIFDLGGGTFDVSIVNVEDKAVTVQAISGNTFLGGRDFDNNLSNFIVDKLNEQFQKDVREIPTSVRRINARSEKVKAELSFETTTELDLHNIFMDGQDVDFEISREDFECVNEHLFKLCIETVDNCLKEANMDKSNIEKVLLVGGSTRIPRIQEMLVEYFGDKDKLTQGINPDEAVAYGAAIQAAMLVRGDEMEEIRKITEVTPLSLGTDTIGNRMSFIITRNTPIPVTKTKTYTTVTDKQKEMAVNVYEGERSLVKYNTKIGKCTITLPPKPPGYPVQVSFHIDVNGILRIGAMTEAGTYTNLAMQFEINNEQKADDILRDALENKENDDRESDVISQWVKLREYCIKMKSLCTYKLDNISEEEKAVIIEVANDVSNWVSCNKVEKGSEEEKAAILRKKNEIETICEPILEKYGYKLADMYISELYKLITA